MSPRLPSAWLISAARACTAAGCRGPATTSERPLCAARSLANAAMNFRPLSVWLPTTFNSPPETFNSLASAIASAPTSDAQPAGGDRPSRRSP